MNRSHIHCTIRVEFLLKTPGEKESTAQDIAEMLRVNNALFLNKVSIWKASIKNNVDEYNREVGRMKRKYED